MNSANHVDPSLRKYVGVFRRRWLLIFSTFSLGAAASVGLALIESPTYESTGQLLVKSDTSASLAGLDQSGLDSLGNLKALGRLSDPIATVVESIQSPPVINRVISSLNLQDDAGNLLKTEDLLSSLSIKPAPGTDIISIKYRNTDPVVVSKVVQGITDFYLESDSARKREKTSEARKFIEGSLPVVKAELRELEKTLSKFKEDNQIASIDDQSVETVRLITRLEERLADNQTQLVMSVEQVAGLEQRLGLSASEAMASVSLSQSSGVQKFLQRKQELEGDWDSAATTYQDNHPSVLSIERELNLTERRISQYVNETLNSEYISVNNIDLEMSSLQQDLSADLVKAEVQRNSLAQQGQRIAELISLYKERLSLLPRLENAKAELERELNASQNTYEALLQRLREIQVVENQPVENVTVLSPATVPSEPLPSRKKMIVALGIIMSSLMSLSLAFLIDWMDRSLKDPQEIQRLSGYPILGIIPSKKQKSISSASRAGYDPSFSDGLMDAYRKISSFLVYYNFGASARTILVSSATSLDERKDVAEQLSISLAGSGKRVLYIDCDLQSIQSKKTKKESTSLLGEDGLIQVLQNDCSLEEAAHHHSRHLSFLSLGEFASAQPTLSYKKLSKVLKQAREEYSFIILNGPSINYGHESLILSQVVDGTILVVNPKYSKSDALTQSCESLRHSNSKVLGILLNSFNEKHSSHASLMAAKSENLSTTLVAR